MAEYLSVTDSRTGKLYKIRINDNAIEATEFAQISDGNIPDVLEGDGLKVIDADFRNTAVVRTKTPDVCDPEVACWSSNIS